MAKKWKYSVGPQGARVQVAEMKRGGSVYLKGWNPAKGQPWRRSLRFSVRDAEGRLIPEAVEEAKRLAAELSNHLIRGDRPQQDVTLGELIARFREEKLTYMNEPHRSDTARELAFWENFLGRGFVVLRLSAREWDAASRDRASGRVDSRGRPVADPDDRRSVGTRTVNKTLKTLRQVIRFGTQCRTDDGRFLISENPTKGLKLQSPKETRRPVADDQVLKKLLAVADRVFMDAEQETPSYLGVILTLAAHTGRRISAILSLRWSDWSLDQGRFGTLRWRRDSDKLGREWVTPVTPDVRRALDEQRKAHPGVGEGWVFPAPNSDGHVTRWLATSWLRRAEELAGIEHAPGFGFHAFRRAWATRRKHLPLRDVSYAGGWVDTQTLVGIYQQADPETVEEVVLAGRPLRMG